MHFHDRTFALLGVTPPVSATALEQIAEVERRIGKRLPASVRDWYSREGAVAIMAKYSNDDPPVKLPVLGVRRDWWPSDPLTHGLLYIRSENQGVCSWAVVLDDKPDPPVLVSYDLDGPGWQPFARTFSDFVFAFAWDWGVLYGRTWFVQGQNVPLSAAALATLRENFDELAATHNWPTTVTYRFAKGDQAIQVSDEELLAFWSVSAGSEVSLIDVLTRLWPLDGVGVCFWSHDDTCDAVVKRLGCSLGG